MYMDLIHETGSRITMSKFGVLSATLPIFLLAKSIKDGILS
jgi:hypothetical protein